MIAIFLACVIDLGEEATYMDLEDATLHRVSGQCIAITFSQERDVYPVHFISHCTGVKAAQSVDVMKFLMFCM
jgi:hypothetical protein